MLQLTEDTTGMRNYTNQQLYPGEFLLHKKYAQTELLLDLIWTHSNIVADIALLLLDKHQFNKNDLPREFVIQAALVFDIGVYLCEGYEWIPGQQPSSKPYIQHGLIGAWILQKEGYSPYVVRVAHTHSGVGLSAQDIRNFGLNLPEADYVPRSQVEKLVSYASKFHSKSPRFKKAEEVKQSLGRYGKEKVNTFEDWENEFGKPDLTEIIEKYRQWHKSYSFQVEQITKQSTQAQVTIGPNLNSAGIAQ